MISDILQKIYNKPCYLVKQISGSSLTFEFGQPYLKILEPRVSESKFKSVRQLFSLRNVTVAGEWHIWIYCCNWVLKINNRKIATNNSSGRMIDKALCCIDGQKLLNVIVNPSNGNSVFEFDLGGRLETISYGEDEVNEQWMLFEQEGNVLSIRDDGRYSYQSGDTPTDEQIWHEIASI